MQQSREGNDETDGNKRNSSLKAVGCDLPSKEEHLTVTSFPAAKRFHMKQDAVEDVNDLLSSLEDPSMFDGQVEDLEHKHYIFVCCHEAVDKRCGYCGPRLVDAFEDYVKENSLGDRVKVVKTSHVGGHKYAGNVMVFPAGE